MNAFRITCRGREQTAVVAAALGRLLRRGDAMLLKGPLASGKTAFVQELVAALGSKAEVTSPTFTLAQFYPLPSGTFLHIDAYRSFAIWRLRTSLRIASRRLSGATSSSRISRTLCR
jgi:tRNA threonylcarbamoyladenosine biosynthesis protein TsaE